MATPHDKDQGTYARDHAMGTGAFRLVEHEPGGRTVLVRNPDWWDAGQHPHQVDRIVRTRDRRRRRARPLRCCDGEVDFVQAVSPDMVAKVRASPGLRVAETSGMRTFWLGFNQGLDELPGSDVKGRNPLRDRRVREAIYRAIDIGELIREALGGAAAPAGVIVVPGINGWSEELDRRLPYDLEGAKRLLVEAGYPDGFALRLSCGKSKEAPCRNIAGQLRARGSGSRPTFVPTTPMPHCSMVMTSNSTSTASSRVPRTTPPRSSARSSTRAATSRVTATRTRSWTRRSRRSRGSCRSPIRDALIEQVWRKLLADAVVVPLYRPTLLWAMRDWLDVPINSINYPLFWEARVRSGG